MKYETEANAAIRAGLSPATIGQTCDHWKALGVTRQTKWNWQNDPERVPLMARLAAAWLIHKGLA
ncbi:hypothetical protein EV128_12214 [Rhizobium azibense]|nr:hypothetical protein EV128_12214 [Rhizobium azibense]